MSSVNRVFLIGNLGKDPESRSITGGFSGEATVCNFSLATSSGPQGKELTQWHNITAWDRTAELCQKYLKKGAKVCVEGRIQYREYEKDGAKQYRTDIVAERVTFLSTKEADTQAAPKEPFSGMKVTKQSFGQDHKLDDIPF